MSDKRYEANIIRTTAVEPANNIETTSAPGVWSLDEVMELQKKNKWPTVGNLSTDVDQVFSTFVYDGTGGNYAIENGIALGNSNDGGSVRFDGAGNTDTVLYSTNTSAITINSDTDFCMEAFINLLPWDGDQKGIIQVGTANSSLTFRVNSNRTLRVLQNAVSGDLDSSTALNVGQWYHVAATRSGSTLRIFIDGTQDASASNSVSYTNVPTNDYLMVGGRYYSSGFRAGNQAYISNARLVIGSAVYTSNFTPTTSDLTAISGTELLTCQGDTPLVDNSSNSYSMSTFTTNDYRLKASAFGPFTGTSGEGGLVWIKKRSGSDNHALIDTARGVGKIMSTNNDAAEFTASASITSFNSNGFSLGNYGWVNGGSTELVSWTFRKKAKFFDIQTWTGTGSARTISHNLGQVPGVIIVKRYSAIEDWNMFHRSLGNTKYLQVNGTGQAGTSGTSGGQANLWNNTDPTSTEFSIGTHDRVNTNGQTYIAYLFAHHNNDGGFGPTASDDIIKCGSYTGNGSTQSISLGFEPQFILLKNTTSSGSNWVMFDSMRGVVTSSSAADDKYLFPNSSTSEGGGIPMDFTATGFDLANEDTSNKNGDTFIYMAIAHPICASSEPTSSTDVFSIDTLGSSAPYFHSDHIVDMALVKSAGATGDWYNYARHIGEKYLKTNANSAEANASEAGFDFMDGHIDSNWGGTDAHSWMWERAFGYFDVVAYTGTGSARTINHNLGVAPEMMWVKRRDTTNNWKIFLSSLGGTKSMELNTNIAAETNGSALWNSTAPTASVLSLGTASDVNGSGSTYIAYLFATVAGISKVGTYTGNGSATGPTVDCGFSSGVRFVFIKRTDNTGDWCVYDTKRGITAGDDKTLKLNTTAAETAGQVLNSTSSGFQLATADGFANASGGSYIFYAIS